jgi:hypothetical protein
MHYECIRLKPSRLAAYALAKYFTTKVKPIITNQKDSAENPLWFVELAKKTGINNKELMEPVNLLAHLQGRGKQY